MSDRDKLQDMKDLIRIIEWYEVELAMKNKIIKIYINKKFNPWRRRRINNN